MAERRWARQTGLKAAALFVGLAVALIGLELLSTAWPTIRDGRYTPASPPDDNSGFGAKSYATMMGLPEKIAYSPSAYMDLTAHEFGIKSMFFLQPVPAIYIDDIHPGRENMDSRGYSPIAARMAQEMAANWGSQAKSL